MYAARLGLFLHNRPESRLATVMLVRHHHSRPPAGDHSLHRPKGTPCTRHPPPTDSSPAVSRPRAPPGPPRPLPLAALSATKAHPCPSPCTPGRTTSWNSTRSSQRRHSPSSNPGPAEPPPTTRAGGSTHLAASLAQHQREEADWSRQRSPKPPHGVRFPASLRIVDAVHGHRTQVAPKRRPSGTGLTVTWPWTASPDPSPPHQRGGLGANSTAEISPALHAQGPPTGTACPTCPNRQAGCTQPRGVA